MRVGIRKFGRRGFRECAALGRTRDLDVYRDRKPEIAYKEVGFLTNDGRVFEQQEIEQNFVERAKQMGGDAVVIMPPVKSLEAPAGWGLFTTFVYEAVVVAYDKAA